MAATLSNTEYNPEQFPGLVIRIKEPKTSALIFSSGKVVCTGARSMDKVEESIKKIIKSLEKINIKITIKPEVKIQNIVASNFIDSFNRRPTQREILLQLIWVDISI
jgi:transcription initiation factor TFIID TATA-box-binding protein